MGRPPTKIKALIADDPGHRDASYAMGRFGVATPSRVDFAVTALIALWGVAEALTFESSVPTAGRVAFALAATLPLAARSSAPLPIAAWAIGVFLFDTAAVVLPLEAVTPLPGVPVAIYAVVVRVRPRRLAVLAGMLAVPGLPAMAALTARDDGLTMGDAIALALTVAVAVLGAALVRTRRAAAARAERAAGEAQRLGEQRLRHGVLAERFRIARELRAIVARSLDHVHAVLADAARKERHDAVGAAAEVVQRVAADTVVEMQRLLRVLRDGGTEETEPMTPHAAVADATARGWPVAVTQRGDPATTAPGAVVAAGRVLEELLEGAPPAGATTVDVALAHRGGGLRLRVRGRWPAPPALLAEAPLARLRQRVRLHGGGWRSRTRGRRRWSVAVELPGAHPVPASTPYSADVLLPGLTALALAADALVGGTHHLLFSLVAGAALVVVPRVARRREGFAVPVLTTAGVAAAVLAGALLPWPYTTMPVVVLGAGTVAAHAVTRARAAMGGAVLVVIGVGVLAPAVGDSTPPTDLAILAFLAGSAWQIGWETRSSGWSLLRARAREARAAVEHHARVRAALDEERRRVARDLHDVVAHGVSLVGVLAGAARATAPRDPAGARARLAAAAQAVADTRRELARLTAMLRSEAEEEPHASPADLMALVDLARAGGQVVLLDGSPPGAVAQGVAASAYRILQEALTNARKHAAAAPVTVRLSSDRGALTIVVANPLTDQPPGAGSGHGIAGMRERARLLDGELSAGPERDGTFVVRARLPLDELAGAVHSRHPTVTRSTP